SRIVSVALLGADAAATAGSTSAAASSATWTATRKRAERCIGQASNAGRPGRGRRAAPGSEAGPSSSGSRGAPSPARQYEGAVGRRFRCAAALGTGGTRTGGTRDPAALGGA